MLVDSTCQTPLWQEKNHAILPSLITNQNLMSMFGQAKDLYKLQKQAKQIKKKLKTLQIEAEVGGVTVTVSAEQEILDVKIADELMASDKKEELANNLKEAINKAVKKSQEVAAEHMKEMMGDLGLGGLPGMGDQPQQ